jgi:hypothetical protein
MTKLDLYRCPLKMDNRFCIEIKWRVFRPIVYQVEPLFAIADAFFIFGRIFIEEEREEIDIVFEKIRNEVIGVLRFFYIQ